MALYCFQSKSTAPTSSVWLTTGQAIKTAGSPGPWFCTRALRACPTFRSSFLVVPFQLTLFFSFCGQILSITPAISGNVTEATITGVTGLYVSNKVSQPCLPKLCLHMEVLTTPMLLDLSRNTSGYSERLVLSQGPSCKSLCGLNKEWILVDLCS